MGTKVNRLDGAPPLHKQIRASVLGKIVRGEWAPGTRIPSENELVTQLGVSRMTVHHVLKALQAEGYIQRAQGSGSFVAESRTHHTVVNIRNIADEIRARGSRYEVEILRLEESMATPSERSILRMSGRTKLFRALMLHKENGIPLQLEDRIVNPASAPDFLQADFLESGVFEYLMNLYPYPSGRHVLRAVRPTPDDIRLLQLEPGEPCLEVERTTWVEHFVVTHVSMKYPAGRFEVVGDISWDDLGED